jgi:hypothetical protein
LFRRARDPGTVQIGEKTNKGNKYITSLCLLCSNL